MVIADKSSLVSRNYPLIYWITIAYIVGLPNFLKFDSTGRTHDFGLFNLTSISRIALTLFTAYALTVNLMMKRGPIFPSKAKISTGAWLLLLAWCIVVTFLQPASRIDPHLVTDLPLSLFRLAEWVIAFILFLTIYTREPIESAPSLVAELIGRSSWILILMVWLALPFFPGLVYGENEVGAPSALGGTFLLPGTLAFESCIAFYYALLFFRSRPTRWLGCLFALVTLEMTRSRTCLIGGAVTLLCFSFFYSRKPLARWYVLGSLLLMGLSFAVFGENTMAYFAKGQRASDLVSLDGRTYVWQASIDAIKSRPFLGYGFVVGAKHAIKDHWPYTHWVPPNAHSELVESLLIGGVPACVLVVWIYVVLIWNTLGNAIRGSIYVFLLLALSQVVIHSVFAGEALMAGYGQQGAVILLCWLATSKRVEQRSQAETSMQRPAQVTQFEAL